ncbi:MAG: hypothetical protein KAG66_03815, partial [Methylococcales bacterium]|nr:hypothetical protein [Methylococcales bacterium]
YLANRFMFEKHNNEFFSMLELFKQGQYATYRSTMVDPWITNQVFDAEFSDWLQTVQSDGCEVDTTRPPSPIEPIEIDDVQGDDQVGLDACSIGDRLVQPDNRIYAGKAVCLTDVSVDGAPLQLALHAPSGLVDVTLQITLRHGNGNPDLTHRYDARPSTTVFDHHSNGPGVEETILVRPVQQNWNYINVLPTGDFSGVTLLAKYIQNQAAITVPVPLTPSGIITTSQATFTWQEVPGAPAYAVVARNDEGAYFVNNSTGSITCPDGICTYSKPNTDFPNGNYTWYVRILNSDNSNGENSEALSFNVNTAAPSTPTPEITSPAPNAILTNSEQQFSWLSNESNVSQWRLTAGSVLGAEDYFESAVLPGPTNSVIVNGLPTDGGEVFVRLWYQQNNTWEFIDASYASLQSNNITPVSPLHNATNHSATTSFQWRNLNRQISANVTDWSYTVMVKDTNNNDKTIHFNAVSPTTRCDNSGCSFQRDLPSGDYKWQVGVYENYADGSYGYHLQTDFINFTVVNEE